MLVIVATFAVCLFQGIHASTIDEVIAEMQPKINAAANSIADIYSNSSSNIDKTQVAIDDLVRSGTSHIYSMLETLDQIVIEAVKEHGDTIEKCVNNAAASRSNISLLPLELCRNSNEWGFIANQLSILPVLQLIVISSPSSCSATDINPDNVRSCILNVLDGAVQQSDMTYNSISSEVSEIKKAALKCISKNTNSMDVQIYDVTKNFKTCIANV